MQIEIEIDYTEHRFWFRFSFISTESSILRTFVSNFYIRALLFVIHLYALLYLVGEFVCKLPFFR